MPCPDVIHPSSAGPPAAAPTPTAGLSTALKAVLCLIAALGVAQAARPPDLAAQASPFAVGDIEPGGGRAGGRPGYLDVPGVTREEIETIETAKAQRGTFVFGNEPTTELFRTVDGKLGGAGALMCLWLSGFFGAGFEPRVMSWEELVRGLGDGSVDFTAEMTPTEERRRIYFMTGVIAERPIQYMRLPGSRPIPEILASRAVRYAYLRGSVNFQAARGSVAKPYVAVGVNGIYEAWRKLVSGEADAFVAEAPALAAFEPYGELAAEDILPMVTSEVAVTTGKPELAAFVSVIQKYLDARGRAFFQEIYRHGRRDYVRARFLASLSRTELDWVTERVSGGMPVFAGLEYDNYPVCFWNEREEEFQGVAVDILREISWLTGLDVRPGHERPVPWAESLAALERGDVSVLSELVRTPERAGRFLWTDAPYMTDRYAFLSLSGFPDAGIGDVPELRVGLSSGTASAELFRSWFPGHRQTVDYADNIEAFGGLERGEVDLVMGTRNEVLGMTNYMERPYFKVNFTMDDVSSDSYFGVSPLEPSLRSIVSKAQRHVDTEEIASRWRTRVFDYRGALARARMPFMAAGLGLLALVLSLVAALFVRSRRAGRVLEEAVAARTEELTRQIAISEQASRAKSEFLARTSHEIRTPMNAIIGFSELARRERGGPKSLDYINGIRSAGASLLTIINDILDFSKIESGSLHLVPAAYGTFTLLNDTVTLIRVRMGEMPVALKLAVSPDLPASLVGDSGRVRQILLNLLSNAVKYTHRGHIRLTVSHERAGEDKVRLSAEVRDTGVGIREQDMEKLFGEFTRLDEKRNSGVEGTGLGLAITRRLCRAMGGDVEARSVYGQGSTFRARIVQGVADWTPMGPLSERPAEARDAHRTTFTAPGAEVMVVDDYASNLMVAEGLLLPYGMRLSFASGGLEAVGLARERAYDLILMDHMMPEMDGVEAMRAIRRLPGGVDIPVVALTANAVHGMRENYLAAGFDDYLTKPIDPASLELVLARWIPLEMRRAAPPDLVPALTGSGIHGRAGTLPGNLQGSGPGMGVPGGQYKNGGTGALTGGWTGTGFEADPGAEAGSEGWTGTGAEAGPVAGAGPGPEGWTGTGEGSGALDRPHAGTHGMPGAWAGFRAGGMRPWGGGAAAAASGGRRLGWPAPPAVPGVGGVRDEAAVRSGVARSGARSLAPVLEGVDVGLGASRAGGSARYMLLLRTFRKDAEGSFAVLADPSDPESLGRLAMTVHALKSACANIGASAMSARAASLEAVVRAGDLEAVERKLPAFRAGLESLLMDIRALSPEEPEPEMPYASGSRLVTKNGKAAMAGERPMDGDHVGERTGHRADAGEMAWNGAGAGERAGQMVDAGERGWNGADAVERAGQVAGAGEETGDGADAGEGGGHGAGAGEREGSGAGVGERPGHGAGARPARAAPSKTFSGVAVADFKAGAAGLKEALESRDIRRADGELVKLQEKASAIGLDVEVDAIADYILTGDYGEALDALDALESGFHKVW